MTHSLVVSREQFFIKMAILFDSIFFDFVALITTLVVILFSYIKYKQSYWQNIGLETLNPQLLFGDCKKLFTGKVTLGEQFQEFYNSLKARGLSHGGIYLWTRPFFVPVDTELVKHIMQTDFQHFVNHGNYSNEESDPLSGNLFLLEDEKWKNMRVKLTPTFTSGKMKMMFQTLADCAVGLKVIMDKAAVKHEAVDVKEVLGRFTTDIIGSTAFGIECNSLKDPDTPFRKYGKSVFEINAFQQIKILIQFFVSKTILTAINFKLTKNEVEKFFMKVVKDTVEYREKNNIHRKDFMHLLLQLKNRGKVTDDAQITGSEKNEMKALTMNELTAQAFVFFIAGFETSSTTMTFALYEIASNSEVQTKLRQEINRVLAKHNDEISYDAISEMTYMQQVIDETLRKYPPVSFLTRSCTKPYTIPNTQITLEKDVMIGIPVLGLHKDPEFYPDPERFDPERFTEENKKTRPAFTWLPFGEGPRMCIGLRFGIMQTKVGLVTLLRNYQLTLNSKTHVPIQTEKKGFIMIAEGGVWIDVKALK